MELKYIKIEMRRTKRVRTCQLNQIHNANNCEYYFYRTQKAPNKWLGKRVCLTLLLPLHKIIQNDKNSNYYHSHT